ncbi:dynein heavy chain, putative [Trypanosoma brucei gambiense DAL972]|uniref:Dynein heavy chain, putative n=1 Tax=Trypanosoma brucei gambiense (strain MHOM/CI/86/DAL972) TaxID=679716 RepID=C9ZLT7_TRYB9|nr:dynein heavy chain, putative [Trypanosoma brucei gambiense DAL972]CBH10362.1 dynein heavy chain, putative [Trypanosoma brucei gambiense DAL972]|eukprot:XP_011772652.1 dynein heavy chain, putative [Trypanosoma brucei gambiense DAL972]
MNGNEEMDYGDDPRLEWFASRVKGCLWGVSDAAIQTLFNDEVALQQILTVFDTERESFIAVTATEALPTENRQETLTMGRPEGTGGNRVKLAVTTDAVVNTNITDSANFPQDRTRCVFFVRMEYVKLPREVVKDWKTDPQCPIHKAFEVSGMIVPSLVTFLKLLKHVYKPLVEDVEAESGKTRFIATKKAVNKYLYTEVLNWVQRIEMQMTGFRSQVCAERRLMIPQMLLSMDNSDAGISSVLANEDIIRQVDITVGQWQAEISLAMSLDPQKEGPLGEIEYWREKYSTISALYEQINSPEAKLIMKVAKEAECNSYHLISSTIQQFFRYYAEAKDNVKFLGTLDRHFRTLHGVTPVTGSLQPIIDTLSSMMTGVRMVWIISRYYCTEERMVGLLEKVAKLISQKVSQHIDFHRILSLPFAEAKAVVTEGQQCLLKWKAAYLGTQEEINSSEREQPWNFNQKRLFETTDYMSDRCTDLLEVIETVEYYTMVLGAQLKTVLTDTSGIERILKDVERVKRPFESLTFDPFERKATHNWQLVFSNFVNMVANLDREVSDFINKIFDDDLRSAESAFELLLSFKCIGSRPQRVGEAFDTASLLLEKADRILAQFFNEVNRVRNIFVQLKDNPPLTKNQPPVAGAIHWSTSLFQRLKKPIIRFQQEGMLNTHMGKQVRAKYAEVAQQMKDYATSRFMQWGERVRQGTTASLKMNIIVKESDNTYVTNFDIELFNLIREAKYLDRLGFEVPQEALNVTLQDESYHANVDALKAMLLNFNYELQNALEGPERVILARNIRELRQALEPGLHDINWTSLGIPDFVLNCERAITKFRNLSREVRKRADHIQTQVVNKIGSTRLMPEYERLLQAGGELPELQVLVETIERRRADLVDGCLRAYSTAKPLLTKVESQLVGTHTGKCLLLESYYHHWEHRIWKAVTKMVLSSLVAFAKMLGYRVSSSSAKRPPLFKVMIFLTTEPTYSPPQQEITSAFHKVQAGIIASTQRFRRWMRGTCIEFTQGELVPRPPEGEHETLFTYYQDINNLSQVYRLQAIINRTIQTHLSALATNIKLLQRYRFVYLSDKKLSVEQQAKNQFHWIDYDAKFQLYFNMIADFDAEKHIHDFGFMRCDESTFYSDLVEHVHQWIAMEGAQLNETVRARMQKRYSSIIRVNQDLERQCEKIEDLKFVLEVMHDARAFSLDVEQDIIDIKYIYESIMHFGVSVDPRELKQAMDLHDLWECTLARVHETEKALEPKKMQFREHTRNEVENFLVKGKAVLKEFRKKGPGRAGIDLQEGNRLRKEWREHLVQLQARREQLTKAEKLFDLPLTGHTHLQQLNEELTKVETVYDLYVQWVAVLKRWNRSSWKDLLLEDLQSTTEEKVKQARVLGRTHGDVEPFADVQQVIANFYSSLPLLAKLKSPALKQRHWVELMRVTSKQFAVEQITLDDFIAMELYRFSDEIDGIVLSAAREQAVEKDITSVKEFWFKAEFVSVPYEPRKGEVRCHVLSDTSEIQEAVDDNILKMQSIANVKWAQPFMDEVKLWEKKLATINDVMAVWIVVQMKWQYLESIFRGSDDIAQQLPKESAKFNELDKRFVRIMNETAAAPNVDVCCNVGGRLDEFRYLEEKLEECQKDLSNFLETKRRMFPRFYFISDDELLSILAANRARAVQDHMLKMFDNSARIIFKNEDDDTVCGVESQEGERLNFDRQVRTEDTPVEEWLQAVLDETHASLHDLLKGGVYYYPRMPRLDWVKKNHGMVTLTGAKIWWTFEVEDSFNAVKKGKKNAVKDLSGKLTRQLIDLVGEMDKDIDKQYAKKINTLIIVDVHGRDIVDRFVRDSITDVREFDWESQLRFYWERDGDTCAIRQCTGHFKYGYEYMGLNGRLVITPLTDRCFMTLTQALSFYLGGAPGGPAGTGKTESVKDLAKAMSIHCVVFNCGEGLDYKAMGTIFSGLSQSGSWGCFDEFNRIELPVLSVVSEQLRSIQSALKTREKEFLFGDTMIRLVPTVGVFITMNPGYAGRVELPDNLKALFRPVVMVVPDMELIAENMLFSEGFATARELAKKMVTLYQLARGQLSKQHHYDWGLRALKAVLAMAGQLKRGAPDLSEEAVLMRALRDMNTPKFVAEDEPLFKGLIGDLFPGLDPTRAPQENLSRAATKVFKDKGFYIDAKQVDKVVQLYETMQTRHTSMVVGPTGGGKSTVIDCLCKSQTQLGLPTKLFVVNPKAQPTTVLYGVMDPMTRSWADGIFSNIFRAINRPVEGGERERRYVVFDGDVDAKWVEDMNSVMDDNKLLTLPNGERIRLLPTSSLLFEVGDLQYASPATVSRVGMVFLDPINLGWKPFMHSWKLNRPRDELETLNELIDKYIEPLINFVLEGIDGEEISDPPKAVIPTSDLNMVRQLTTLIDTVSSQKTSLEPKALQCVFIFCSVWSFGALITTEEDRLRFDKFLKKITGWNMQDVGDKFLTRFVGSGSLPERKTMYDYFFDLEDNRWKPWHVLVCPFERPPGAKFGSLLVGTPDTERNMWLLNKIVLNRTPVMLVGKSGTAKTVTIQTYLRQLKQKSLEMDTDGDVHLEEMILEMNFSSRTTSLDAQRAMEDNIEKRTNTVLGPPAKKRLVVFIDDINMPKVDLYGTQQPIAFLKLLIEHQSWYDRKDLLFKNVRDTQFVSAMAPPGGGRNALDPRFVSLFTVFNVLFPSDESINTIYGQILTDAYKSMSKEVADMSIPLTTMTLNLYQRLFVSLPATPAKFHYIFNLRDFSRVYEGLCRATPEKFPTRQSVVRLWRNEIYRVFVDRMSDEDDKGFVSRAVEEEIRRHFPDVAESAIADPLMFGDFGDFVVDSEDPRKHIYEDFGAEYSKARQLVEAMLDEVNTPTKKMDLVMFDMALDHLLRITRVISLPRGNCLLVGVGGSGKQSLTRLAAAICQMEVFEVVLSRNYNEDCFREDLKRLYTRVGVQQKQVVFLFMDSHVKEEGFLELINNMLASGMVPALFTEEEKEPLYNSVLRELEANKLAPSKDNKWTAFVSRCRDNLHVVLSMSPSGEVLRTRCRSFPALINNTTIDWFQKWPPQALEAVGTRILQSEDLPEEVKASIVNHVVYVHVTADDLSARYQMELKRYNYVTPKNFLGFLANYSKLLTTRREDIDDLVKKFAIGLERLDHAQEDVKVLQEELAEKEVTLREKQDINERMTSEIKDQKTRNEKRKAEALVMEEELNVQNEEIERESAQAQEVLALAMPALEEATEAVKHINPKSITELKSFAKPPASVVAVVRMVCVVKGVPATWESGRTMMGQNDFIRSLVDIDSLAGTLNQGKINEINRILKEFPVNSNDLKKVSLAASGLMIWVEAMKAYWNTAKEVLPKQARVRELQDAKAKAERQLAACQDEIQDLTAGLRMLEERLEAGMSEARRLQQEKALMERRLNAARKLLDGFGSERVRWAEQKETLGDVRNRLVGDCLAGAAFLSYLGAFTFSYRQEALESVWLKDIRERNIPLSEGFTIQHLLTDEVSISQWASDGLPSDDLSVQNGILTTMSTQPPGRGKKAGRVRFPLCIDPQMQAVNWIKRQHKSNPRFECASFSDADFLKRLEFAIQYGNPFLFEGVDEFIDPIIDSVLDPQFRHDSGQLVIRLGDKDVVWDSNFKLYLCTKLPNPEYPAEVFGKTMVINYGVTEDGLESQLLNFVVASERSDLQRQSEDLVQTMAESRAQLKELEDTLIRELTLATGNILDNDELIATLENTKSSATEVQQKLEQAKETARVTELSRQEYRPAARRGAVLYFVISELSVINSMYEYSLSAFLHDVFGYSITKSDASFEIKDRLRNIIRALTYNLYCYVCMGIFEKDKLMLSFQMAIRLLTQENQMVHSELEFFLRGCVLASKDYPPHTVEWMSERQWNDLCKLAHTCEVFENVCDDVVNNSEEWRVWATADRPEDPSNPLPSGYSERITEFQLLCLLRCFRHDRIYTAVSNFVSNCELLGEEYVIPPILSYKDVLDKSSSTSPIVCIVSPGANPTDEIIKLATKEVGIQKLRPISLGQGQGEEAMKLVEVGVGRGHWVLLQNCHLLTTWMKELEKVIERMNQTPPQEEFRLWLTTEPSRDFPMGILQRSLKVVNEPPNGLKMNMKNTLSKVTEDQLEECPHSAFRPLVFALAFFHAVVQERRKYGKIGWNVVYDFNETDFSVSMRLLDTYLAKAHQNDDPIPWDTLRYLVGEVMYGGRVTDSMDRRIVKTYLEEYFGDFLFDTFQSFHFFKNDVVDYCLPADSNDVNKRVLLQQMMAHVEAFPKDNTPEVFGLHPNAETGYLRNAVDGMWASLIEMMPRSVRAATGGGESREEVLLKLTEEILTQIPEPLDRKSIMRSEKEKAAESGHENLQPTQVVLLQEIERWNRLVVVIVLSLKELQKALSGIIGMSSELDELATSLHNGHLPSSWRRYAPATRKKLVRWLAHFQKRCKQYVDWATHGEPKCMWLTGLMVPESYISALVQVTCRRYKWPLDRSSVVMSVTRYLSPNDVKERPKDGAYVCGLFIEGARWDTERHCLAPQVKKVLTAEMPVMQIIPMEVSKIKAVSVLKTPVYVTSERRNAAGVGLVLEADLKTDTHASLWTLESVALILDSDE